MRLRSGAPAEDRTEATEAPTRPVPRVRVARLRLSRLDPWSVMKVAFMLSIALFIVVFVAVALVWLVLQTMGVFESLGAAVEDVTGAGEGSAFDVVEFLSLSRVLGFTTMIGLINVVLVTALATLFAFLYNLTAALAGGVDVTFTETDRAGWDGSGGVR